MVKIKFVLLVASMFAVSLFAQKDGDVKFGKSKMDELTMMYCSIDSAAGAVILYEKGEVELAFDPLGVMKMVYNYHVRYKILKKSGLYKAIIKIPFIQGGYDEDELISNIGGYTYNLVKGRIAAISLAYASVKDEQINGTHFQKIIAMPDVKEGSVFEIRYTMERIFNNKVHNPDPWIFQKDIPVMWSEFKSTFPLNIKYRILKTGIFPIIASEDLQLHKGSEWGKNQKAKVNRFIVKNALPFHEERYLNSKADYISKLDYELVSITMPNSYFFTYVIPKIEYTETWEQVHHLIQSTGEYGENLGRNGLLKDAIKSIEPVKDTMERIKRAFEYISKAIKWDGKMSLLEEDDPNLVFKNRTGSATEINLILVSLLTKLDLPAKPVIISTREHGKITPDFPVLRQFNYTIACVKVKGKNILMDATDPLTRPGVLPERCLNDKGILLDGRNSGAISLAPEEKDFQLQTITVGLDANTFEGFGKIDLSKAGYSAHRARIMLSEIGEAALIKSMYRDQEDWKFEKLSLSNKENVYEPLALSCNFKFPFNEDSGCVSLNPMFSGRVDSNPFKESFRIYPLDLAYGKDEVCIITIKVPDEYEIVEIPKSTAVTLPDNIGKFTYLSASSGNTIKISSRITLNEFYFPPEQYEMLKNFYDRIIQKQAEQVILKKNK